MNTFRIDYQDPHGQDFQLIVAAEDAAFATAVWELQHPLRFGYVLHGCVDAAGQAPHVRQDHYIDELAASTRLQGRGWLRWIIGVPVLIMVIVPAMVIGYHHGQAGAAHDPLPWSLLGLAVGVVAGSLLAIWATRHLRRL